MRTAKNTQGIATSTIVIVAMTSIGMTRDIASPMLAIILLILLRTAFTSFLRDFSHSRDQGLLSPFDESERKLSSIIQLIVRNVKHIFIQGYILQIAVLIAASGAFGDQIK